MALSVSFTGHRPHWDSKRDKLGTGYSITNERVKAYSDLIKNAIRPLVEKENGQVTFISGGALGIDQIAFWTVHSLKEEFVGIQNVLAIPFERQYSNWKSEELLKWYHQMKRVADEIVYVDTIPEYALDTFVPVGDYSSRKMQLRNEYMVNNSDIVVAVWNGSQGGTGNCVRYAKEQGKEILRLHPIKFE